MVNSKKRVFYFYTLLTSLFFSGLSYDIGFSLKPYMVVTLFGFFIYLKDFLNWEKIKSSFGKQDIFLFLFFIFYSLSFFQSSDRVLALRFIYGFILISGFYCINKVILKPINFANLRKGIYYIFLGVVIISLVYYFLGLYSLDFDYVGIRLRSYGVMAERNNPRLIGFMSADPNITFFHMTQIFIYSLINIKYNHFKLIAGLSFIALTLTLSRGGMLGLLFSVFVYIFFIDKTFFEYLKEIKTKYQWKYLAIPFTVVVSFLFFLVIVKTNLFARFLLVFKDGGSGRIGLIKNGLEQFVKTPLLGMGLHNSILLTYPGTESVKYLHNTHLEVLVESGLIGFSAYLLFFIVYFKRLFTLDRNSKKFMFIFTLLISLIIQMTFLSLTLNEMFYFALLMGSIFIETNLIKK